VKIKEAKIFKNGQSQAIRLPKEFRFKGKSVYIKHFGNGVLLLPKDSTWSLLEESLNEFSDDFMNSRDQGKFEDREGIDS
jgi:antitoxin VapB